MFINAFNSISKNLSEDDLRNTLYKDYVNKNDIENKDVEATYKFSVEESLFDIFNKISIRGIDVDRKIINDFNIKEYEFTRFINKSKISNYKK